MAEDQSIQKRVSTVAAGPDRKEEEARAAGKKDSRDAVLTLVT